MENEIKVFFKPDKNIEEKRVLSGSSKRIRVTGEEDDYRTYEETDIGMWVNQDGAIGLIDWNKEGMIYLYPDQLEHLQKVLEVALSQRSAEQLSCSGCGSKRPGIHSIRCPQYKPLST